MGQVKVYEVVVMALLEVAVVVGHVRYVVVWVNLTVGQGRARTF